MTRDSLEPHELKEQTKASTHSAADRSAATSESSPGPSEPAEDQLAPAKPRQPRVSDRPRSGFVVSSPIDLRILAFAGAFVAAGVATLVLLSAVAFSFSGQYESRVLPGVHAGSVDLSGLTREQAVARAEAAYGYLSQGEVTLTTPVGASTITYAQLGRAADVDAIVDAALAVGHTGSPIVDAAGALHSATFGQEIPVVVKVDPDVLAQRIHDLVATSTVSAQDAQAVAKDGEFSVTRASAGIGVDERGMGRAIIEVLADAGAPVDLKASGAFVSLTPRVSDSDADSAVAQARKMAQADVKITWTIPPAAATGTWAPHTWTITQAQIGTWTVFGMGPNGKYSAAVDPAQVKVWVASISAKANVQAMPPSVVFSPAGKPTTITQGKAGIGVDLNATTASIASYLDSLATGGSVGQALEVTTLPISPVVKTVADVSKFVVIGSWRTTFIPGPGNGGGANIAVPAKNLNTIVVAPGEHFSFLRSVGPIDAAHGFAEGGVIVYGRSEHTGAMGGGICSASTTMFNAAVRAGLQIDERYAHFYAIGRYPLGLDATVFSNGSRVMDLQWTNDTPNPIVIHSWSVLRGTASYIEVQLWSLPLNRTVSWSGNTKADRTNIVKAAQDTPQYVRTLAPGKTYLVEQTTDGFDMLVTRVVKDSKGKVIHTDKFASHYTAVNGLIQIGITPSPGPSSSSSSTPTAPIQAFPPVIVLFGSWRRRPRRKPAAK